MSYCQLLAEGNYGQLFVWSLVLVISLIALFGVLQVYRKWMNATNTGGGAGFTLSDLRKLHKEGKMTDEEYDKAKMLIIGTVKKSLDKPKVTPPTDLSLEQYLGGRGTEDSGGASGATPAQGPRNPGPE